jgi:2-phospho-L-lactate guanylyltransferase
MTRPPSPPARRYAVLVPVKPPAVGKSRLGGLGDGTRRALAEAFAADTVAALLGCDRVQRVLVVSDDAAVARRLAGIGAEVVPDGTDDLNGALVQAAAEMHRRDPGLWLAAVCADLPALRPEELAVALDAADATRMSFVSDEDGVGTTALMAPDVATFRPCFGGDSRRGHLAAGAYEIDGVHQRTLRRDVDEPEDLAEALRLGVGPCTAAVCASLVL